jgi:DNA-binding response OmpR family regulator
MPASTSDSLKILVVEDEFLIAEEMTAVLEDAGHVVVGPAGSVRGAEDMLAGAAKPDVAVIDANLRGETSAQLAISLRDRGIPFCVCTGYRVDDLKTLFGDIITIQKPIDPARLLKTVTMLARGDSG